MAQRAIVTGASSGIGAAVAQQLAADGWTVLAVARRRDRLEALAREHRSIVPHVADLTTDGVAERLMAGAMEQMGGLDLLVNAAGAGAVGELARMPVAAIDAVLTLDLRAPLLLCRAAIPLLCRAQGAPGQIINIASLAAHEPMPQAAVYCAAKAALVMLGKVLRRELAPLGIRVQTVSPTGTDTEMFERLGVPVDRSRLLRPQDVASMVVQLTRLPSGVDVEELKVEQRGRPGL